MPASIQDVIDALALFFESETETIEEPVRVIWDDFRLARVSPYYDLNLDVKSLPALLMQAQSENWGAEALNQLSEVAYGIELTGLVHLERPELAHRVAIEYARSVRDVLGGLWAPGFTAAGSNIFCRDFPVSEITYGASLTVGKVVRGWSMQVRFYSQNSWEYQLIQDE
jgi:hypothetical protein